MCPAAAKQAGIRPQLLIEPNRPARASLITWIDRESSRQRALSPQRAVLTVCPARDTSALNHFFLVHEYAETKYAKPKEVDTASAGFCPSTPDRIPRHSAGQRRRDLPIPIRRSAAPAGTGGRHRMSAELLFHEDFNNPPDAWIVPPGTRVRRDTVCDGHRR
jgi:hypothetical protein